MPSDTIVQFDFSEALTHLRQGKRVRRLAWDKRFRWIELTTTVISINISGVVVAWTLQHTLDLLARDWVLVEQPLTAAGS